MANTPLIEQYLSIKKCYENELLFFRLGDFYELYYADAKIASNILGLVLTERKNQGDKIPMCGIPYHALLSYVPKLIEANYRVAVVEQSDSITNDGLAARTVARVFSAGTLIEEEVYNKKGSNHLVSIYRGDCGFSICWADVSTGEINTEHLGLEAEALEAKLISLMPAEIIMNSAMLGFNSDSFGKILPKPDLFYDIFFTKDKATEVILRHYKINSMNSMDIVGEGCICAAGALIEYVAERLMTEVYLNPIREVCSDSYMHIDANTRRNLDLIVTRDNRKKGSLLWLLDRTQTPMGERLLNCWLERPLSSLEEINERLYAVSDLQVKVKLAIIRDSLSNIPDVCKIMTKLSYKLLRMTDVVRLAVFFQELPKIQRAVCDSKSGLLYGIYKDLNVFNELTQVFRRAVGEKDDTVIKCGYDAQCDRAYETYRSKLDMLSTYCDEIRNKSGIKSLKLENNKIYGYYFEINERYEHLAPVQFIKKSSTTKGGRYITARLKELEEEILHASLIVSDCEQRVFSDLCKVIAVNAPALRKASNAIAMLDILSGFAEISLEYDYTMPKIVIYNGDLILKGSRHALVERFVKEFINNDLIMKNENRFVLITGPNMSGKSTYMRQIAIITIMAHLGCFVPADSAEIPLVDKLFTRVGASDDLLFNLSTFMVEMTEAAYITNTATENSLIILDELGRGTSTSDGISMAQAIAEFIAEGIRAKTLFATHYRELCELEGRVDGVVNFHFTVNEENNEITFLNKIERGCADKSFGIEVAQIAGVNKSIIERARAIQAKAGKG